jgi:hypothetical protein
MGSVPFTVFLFSCTVPSPVTTATWGAFAVHVDAGKQALPGLLS